MKTIPMINVGIANTTLKRRRRSTDRCSRTWIARARSSRVGGWEMETLNGGDEADSSTRRIVRIVKVGGSGL